MANINVSLDCRISANADSSNGYTNTTTSANTTYCYKYSGGSDDHGGVTEITGSNAGTITVTSGRDPRFIILNIIFPGDTNGDLTWGHGTAPNQAIITDNNVDNESASYTVLVEDTTANCTFPCDPPITNKPPSN